MKPIPLILPTMSSFPGPVAEREAEASVQLTNSRVAAGRWDDRNEARPGVGRTPKPDEHRLRTLGYTVYPISRLKVLNGLAERDPDAPLGDQPIGDGGFDVVSSGTFIYDVLSRGTRVPAGPVMRGGTMDGRGVEKGQRRGAVAALEDGTLRIARTGGASGYSTAQTLQAAFGSGEKRLVELCGGGALLIERGSRVQEADLIDVQRFDSGQGGFQSPQLRDGLHIGIGICQGGAWLIVAHSHGAQTVQEELHVAGFGSLVLFDGGSGGFLRDLQGTPYRGRDVQGFGITLRG